MLTRVTICAALVACGHPTTPEQTPDATATADAGVDATPVVEFPPCTTPGTATYTLDRGSVIAPDLVGFGAQYNANAYAAISAAAGITPANVVEMEAKTIAMQPRHVRVFWSSTATADEVDSFERTITLAERSGASVNVTYWHGPYPDPTGQMATFSNELVRLVHDLGHDSVREVTIQNEVNSTMVTQPLYEQLYRSLDQDLRAAGIRDHIKFICGDLLRTNQASWFDYLATHMSDVCDGYSVHIYWDYFDIPYMVTRLTEVHDLVAAMPAGARKPVYVTEFGVRGDRPNGEADPGLYSDGQLLARTNENAFQHAWFNVLATRLGFVSTLKWDAFYAKYDNGSQFYSSIGTPPEWFVKPVYFATQLFTASVAPGWSSVAVTGGAGSADLRLLTGFAGSHGNAAAVALNKGPSATTVTVTGLPPGTALHLLVWHGEGAGNLTTTSVTSTDRCQVTFTIPARSVAAVSTLAPSAPQ